MRTKARKDILSRWISVDSNTGQTQGFPSFCLFRCSCVLCVFLFSIPGKTRALVGPLRWTCPSNAVQLLDRHSHACILPECGMFCTPTIIVRAGTKDTLCFRHGCQVAQKTIYGCSKHMCRNCHQTATQCKAAVCTYIACSRSQKFCEHLHGQRGAMKTSATEASALEASVVLP